MQSLLSYKLHVIQVTGTIVHVLFSVLISEHTAAFVHVLVSVLKSEHTAVSVKKNLQPSTIILTWQNVNDK